MRGRRFFPVKTLVVLAPVVGLLLLALVALAPEPDPPVLPAGIVMDASMAAGVPRDATASVSAKPGPVQEPADTGNKSHEEVKVRIRESDDTVPERQDDEGHSQGREESSD